MKGCRLYSDTLAIFKNSAPITIHDVSRVTSGEIPSVSSCAE